MKPRIIFLIASTKVGGGPQVVFDLISGLRKDFEFVGIASSDGPFFGRFIEAGARVYNLPLRTRNPFLVFRILRIIRRERPALLHTHGKGAGIYGRTAAFFARVPVIHTTHGIHIGSYIRLSCFFYLWLERVLSYFTDRIVSVSESERLFALNLKLFPPARLVVIPNGVSFTKFDSLPNREAVRRSLGFYQKDVVIIGVGRLVPQKNFKEFLEVVSRVLRGVSGGRTVIVGDGAERAELQEYARALQIDSATHFLGTRGDVPALLNASDIFFSTSRWEGMPLTVLEAMAAGLPVVASDVVGNRDLVRDSETGFLYPLGDIGMGSERVLKLIRNSELRRRLGQVGAKLVRSRYSLQETIRSYKNLYYDVIKAN